MNAACTFFPARSKSLLRFAVGIGLIAALIGCRTAQKPIEPTDQPVAPREPPPQQHIEVSVIPPPKIGLVLGGGAARGFAHVGVIKMLESQGLRPDLIVGTSAGSVVGALYASGYTGFDLQRIALELDEKTVSDWTLPNRGFLRGESLQSFVNSAVKNRNLEQLSKPLGVVVTDLRSGERVVLRRGNTGMAVRASSSIPGVFQPVVIGGREFVDGGVTSPVPVRAAREMGAEFVIAVDISRNPQTGAVDDTVGVLLQTFLIMGRTIAAQELPGADIVISPDTREMASTTFESRNVSIIEGEKAALAAIPLIRRKIEEREARLRMGQRLAPASLR